MPDIKIKRYADKENLKKLVKYSKDTFANKSEINEKFYTKEQIDTMLREASGGTGGSTGGGSTSDGTCSDCYTKSEIDTKLNSKANKTTTLSGYGITDAYTKPQVDKKVSDLVNSAPETLATLNELAKALGDDPNFATTVATQIGKKANSSDVYNKSETDTLLSDLAKKSDLAKVATTGSYNDLLDKPTSFDVDLDNYYTKSEVDNLLSNIGSGTEGGDDAQNVLKSWPNGPEAHNAMWGGRDITAAFDSGEFSEHVADGTFKDIFPGDYIMKQVTIPRVLADDGTTELYGGDTYTIDWVITDCDYWTNTGHHVVIVPGRQIFYTRMNPTNTTEGGYAGSEMFKKIIPACATGIVNAFGADHILTFRDAITNSVDTSHASSGLPQRTGTPGWWGTWVSVKCNLMSEKMVYGAPIFAAGAMDNVMAIRQMSAFRLSSSLINNYIWGRAWWLRDVVSSTHFAAVYGYTDVGAYADCFGASNEDRQMASYPGVRPFALLR